MTAQPQISETEQALQEWGVKYLKQKDGTIVVEGTINISGKNLTKLPDLTKVIVKGGFWCQFNKLTSLAGAPAVIGGSFSCADNQLTSLEGAPSSVGESFWCNSNQLTSLAFAPLSVGGDFWCHRNQLTSLEGAPAVVHENFSCSYNQLTSLEGGPSIVNGDFRCINNPLTSLEGAAHEFKKLVSDFGTFLSWREVPENLRTSPETKEKNRQRAEKARLEMHRKIADAGEKKQIFKPAPSIRFKARPK